MRTSAGPSLHSASERHLLEMIMEHLKEILNRKTLKELQSLTIHLQYNMLIQGIMRDQLCMDLLQLLPLLFRAQSSREGKRFLHRLQALTPRASGNLLHRPKVLDQRA